MNQSVVSSDATSLSEEYPDARDNLQAPSEVSRRRQIASEYGVSIRPLASGINVLEIPLSRPLRAGVLQQLASHKDREGLIERALAQGL